MSHGLTTRTAVVDALLAAHSEPLPAAYPAPALRSWATTDEATATNPGATGHIAGPELKSSFPQAPDQDAATPTPGNTPRLKRYWNERGVLCPDRHPGVEQPSDPDGNQAEPDRAPDPADLPDPHSTRKPTPAGGLTYATDRSAPPDHTAAANTTDSGPPAATPIESEQYTSIAFGQRCEQAGVRPSTGRTGTCFDNAITESFFASLECELIDRRTFHTRSEAERALFSYIEGFLQPAPPALRQRPAQPRRVRTPTRDQERPRPRLCCRVVASADVSIEPRQLQLA
ncbi:hypothetical protein HD597_000166 [Nonomuraea thailandensis]|uniref:Integrase catalytic domain-containing protein n=1 Tax=Nonomuraea thailandensis TaxID=1188745 RepID=A0A9X2GD89_9ACTN|nr:hypothetical protein [Nonomuraea thailandensis]